jgi:hypothetical protein
MRKTPITRASSHESRAVAGACLWNPPPHADRTRRGRPLVQIDAEISIVYSQDMAAKAKLVTSNERTTRTAGQMRSQAKNAGQLSMVSRMAVR